MLALGGGIGRLVIAFISSRRGKSQSTKEVSSRELEIGDATLTADIEYTSKITVIHISSDVLEYVDIAWIMEEMSKSTLGLEIDITIYPTKYSVILPTTDRDAVSKWFNNMIQILEAELEM